MRDVEPFFREKVREDDREAVAGLVEATGLFSAAECAIAVELVDAARADPDSGYLFWLAEHEGRLLGYTCFGAVPATQDSFDLYWIVVDPACQRRGLGRVLLAHTERSIAALGGRRLWVDTSGREAYAETRRFYESAGFRREATLRDFYAPGDDKVIYGRTLGPGDDRR